MTYWIQKGVRAAIIPLLLLLIWQICAGRVIPEYLLPAPLEVLKALQSFLFGDESGGQYAGTFTEHASASAMRVLTGFSLAALLGVPLGIISGRSVRVAAVVDPFVQLIRSVPGISWLPLAIVWFGIGTVTAVFLIVLAAFFPVYVNAFHGARNISPRWVQAARMLGAGRIYTLFHVILPGAMPAVESGLRLSMGISWAYVVLGELTGVNEGLGAMIMDARMLGDVRLIIVGIICIAVLGRLFDLALLALFRLIPGHSRPRTTGSLKR